MGKKKATGVRAKSPTARRLATLPRRNFPIKDIFRYGTLKVKRKIFPVKQTTQGKPSCDIAKNRIWLRFGYAFSVKDAEYFDLKIGGKPCKQKGCGETGFSGGF